MKINIQEIIDYSKCPMYHFHKYKAKSFSPYIDANEKYDSEMHKVLYGVFNRFKTTYSMTLNHIMTLWGKFWIKDKRRANLLLSDTNNKDIYADKRRKGINSLSQFYKKFENFNDKIILCDYNYSIELLPNITLEGTIELLSEKEDSLSLYTFKVDDHTYNKSNKEYEYKLIAASIASRDLVSKKDITFKLYHIDKGKLSSFTDFRIIEEDFKTSVNNIAFLIKNKVYYMVPDDRCNTCIYRDSCSKKENFKIKRIRWK